MGCEVIVFSSTESKREEALQLGGDVAGAAAEPSSDKRQDSD